MLWVTDKFKEKAEKKVYHNYSSPKPITNPKLSFIFLCKLLADLTTQWWSEQSNTVYDFYVHACVCVTHLHQYFKRLTSTWQDMCDLTNI